MRKLPRGFYTRDTILVARELLGMHLVRVICRDRLVGKIVEVEAYPGTGDPASHSYRGKTARNAVMFDRGGHLYVYFTYGMHFCANVVTGRRGTGCAVLIRAVEPVEGTGKMIRNRGRDKEPMVHRLLTGGPARVCQAFGLNMRHNGTDLTGPKIFLSHGETVPDSGVERRIRIGLSQNSRKKWRFYIRDNPFVSRK